jgi:hypothetical protein
VDNVPHGRLQKHKIRSQRIRIKNCTKRTSRKATEAAAAAAAAGRISVLTASISSGGAAYQIKCQPSVFIYTGQLMEWLDQPAAMT